VLLRLLWAIPHAIVLSFLGLAWGVVYIISWLAVIITGSHPAGLYNFSVGVLRWSTRLEAYVLLLTDEYPPFSLS
jgi:hypothetical protein